MQSWIALCSNKTLLSQRDRCNFPRGTCISYTPISLCEMDTCDAVTTDCKDLGGLVSCKCKPGYLKFREMDRTCRDCRSGYHLTVLGDCQRCSFGYGGFNCSDAHLLHLVIVAVVCFCLCFLLTILSVRLWRSSRRAVHDRRLIRFSPYPAEVPSENGVCFRPRLANIKCSYNRQLSSFSVSSQEPFGAQDYLNNRTSYTEAYQLSFLSHGPSWINSSCVSDGLGERDYF
uniref:EGF-like domain-containing protein n=1 Tax=Eptatretus burgeri TaxID=7764 RepID=A0A8C4R5E1_EPTBU